MNYFALFTSASFSPDGKPLPLRKENNKLKVSPGFAPDLYLRTVYLPVCKSAEEAHALALEDLLPGETLTAVVPAAPVRPSYDVVLMDELTSPAPSPRLP